MPSAEHEITEDLSLEELEARMAALVEPPVLTEDARAHLTSDDRPTFQPEPSLVDHRAASAAAFDQHVSEHYGINMGAARAIEPELAEKPLAEYRMFDPLPNAADEYIRFAQSPHERIFLGVDEFDDVMRGIAPGELLLVVGFAHSGKTVLTAEVILNNRDKRILFFTPDETRVLVLVKLCSLIHGISAEDLEHRIANDDVEAIEMIRSTARDHFPHLAVFDQGVGLKDMDRAWDETTHAWGAEPQLVIFDYLELLDGFDEVKSACNGIKAWGKNHRVPLMLLHQSSRTSGADGKSVTISSGGFGGEQQATFLIGVRRKKSEIMARILDLKARIATTTKDPAPLEMLKQEAEYELRQHEHTVTFNLVKNKRPPSRLVDEIDFQLDQRTGRVTKLERGDLVHSVANRSSSSDAIAKARGYQRTITGDEEPF